MAFMLLYWTGMRIGELLALTYADIDLEKRIISISKSYQRLDGKDVITPPKTPKSNRKITIPPFLAEELKEYCSHLYGIMPNERMFRFTKSYMEHEIVRGIKETGVKRIRIHDLRHSQDRRLVVSVELAKILSDKTEYLSRLNIITYKSLKGVWQNRLYPIIWYHDSKVSGVSFEDSFYYDETTYSQLSKAYFSNREKDEGDLTSYMFLDVHKALGKIINDQKLGGKLEQIYQVINDTENDVIAVENEFDNKLLEFHCAVVCCDVDNKKILIAKRKNRKFFSGLWEFGCAKASIDENLCDSIKKEYKNDFGIEIDIICDDGRNDKEPKPIALYQVNKVDKLQKGVIVVAKIIQNVEQIDGVINKRGKHEKYKWITEEEVETFDEPAINDFKDTLKKVFTMWDEMFKEK